MPTSVPLERDEMRTLSDYLDTRRFLWCHVPNENRHRRYGTKAGVPDVLIFDPVPGELDTRGVAIELKRVKGGVETAQQQEWHDRLAARLWHVRTCYGAADAIAWVESLWPVRRCA